jgi:Na+/H+-dicarboxylate symporter
VESFLKRYGLLLKIAIGTILGIIVGLFMPEGVISLVNILNLFISKFINFAVPLIIIGFVVNGISSLEFSSGKILGITCAISYVFMLVSGFVSYFVSINIFPMLLNSALKTFENPIDMANTAKHLHHSIDIPPIMDVTSALILSFIIGIGISCIKGNFLKNVFSEFHSIIEMFVHKIMVPLIPIYVFGVFVKMSSSGHIQKILSSFSKVILIIVCIHLAVMFMQYIAAGLIAKKNPLELLKNVIPSYTTALATQSSVAVIPVSVKNALANGVSEGISNFILPLCATIHLSGSIISITCNSIAVMIINEIPVELSNMIPFMFMLSIVMVAAPGVPCGAIFAASGILQSVLGFDHSMIALMIALHVAQDGFGTACNVTGDGAIAVILENIKSKMRGSSLPCKDL